MKGRQPCKFCGDAVTGSYIANDGEVMWLCEVHLGLMVNNKRGIKERISGLFSHRGGSMRGMPTPMPRSVQIYSIILIIGWISALVFCLLFLSGGYHPKLVGGAIGWLMIFTGGALLLGVTWGKEQFWNEWLITGKCGGRRMYYLQWTLGVVLVILSFILWVLDVIWLL
jgi:hypothetical protein